ncbi:hypothetical protein GW819_03810 [Candidatus Gracilibacteria bacterium]|nr:hypothetical protein [bacterium]NDK19942.1 hypothetical protein [Candidatus Gracilibacteria bacterium]OIO77541.1 MAG: hypothetical protein AUJ87_01090 [Candidatus Gracilibacteria bacterium CG1_02_38_174]PIQ11172.1 MAG: hypothetical protein COW68_03205 [Candidatus Gracilibacteria bacterium CG18_big_fil_WC_8_21_14_2_50_38_16]PIQ40910.1 MAG: hypothetical protein COW06_04595 [Candidatus Gracilibacteria bacterium CG12_big_fil_rev_8_21_14_0_65_38_15]PIZ01435.1 MAG: hypothetical protein COY60_0351
MEHYTFLEWYVFGICVVAILTTGFSLFLFVREWAKYGLHLARSMVMYLVITIILTSILWILIFIGVLVIWYLGKDTEGVLIDY